MREEIACFKTQQMRGYRLQSSYPTPRRMREYGDSTTIVDPRVLMNFLVRQSGSKVHRSNIGDESEDGRIRHLKIWITDIKEDESLLLRGPFLNEVSKMACYVWDGHKDINPNQGAERMESAHEGAPLRKILLLDPEAEQMGFSEVTLEMFEVVGDVEWDSSIDYKKERYPDKYQWTLISTKIFVRESDGRLFHVLWKFHYGRVTVYDRM